jgi:hypothetical protein
MLDVKKVELHDRVDPFDKFRRRVVARITCTEMVPYSVAALPSDSGVALDQAKRAVVTRLWQRFYADLRPALHELRNDAVKFLDYPKATEVDAKFQALFAKLADPSPELIDALFVRREQEQPAQK